MKWLPRFMAKVAWPVSVEECWLWTAALNSSGYGSFAIEGRGRGSHRIAYELRNGPVPAGFELDHLCRVRNCVNPDHMEPVTTRANVLRGIGPTARHARKTHCIHGHPFDDVNTRIRLNGGRDCLACRRGGFYPSLASAQEEQQ